MKLHKILLAVMASAMVLSVGVNFPIAQTNARHVRTYRVRRHHIRRHSVYHSKKFHYYKHIKRQRRHVAKHETPSLYKNKAFEKSWKKYLRTQYTFGNNKNFISSLKQSFANDYKQRKLEEQPTRIQEGIKALIHLFRSQGEKYNDAKSNAVNVMYNSTPEDSGDSAVDNILSKYQPVDGMADYKNIIKGVHRYNIGVKKMTQLLRKQGYDNKSAKFFGKDEMINGAQNADFDNDGNKDDEARGRILKEYGQLVPSDNVYYAQDHHVIPMIAPQDKYTKTVEQRELYDINKDRASAGESPDVIDPELQHVAEMRAPQLAVDFDHEDQNGNDYTNEDDNDTNDPVDQENICSGAIGDSAKISADNVNVRLYYDELPNEQNPDGGGHYQSIMHNDGKVGIGYYGGNVAEEF